MSGLLLPGTCRICGCTDDEACEGGCFWLDSTATLCSQCKTAGPGGRLIITPDELPELELDEGLL
jgi:hypothetical protein